MDDEELVPDAELMESMRAVGYSLQTAVADICDNSVAAAANHVDVFWHLDPEPHVYVLDDGVGMSRDQLRTAMKLAGRSPLASRTKSDLGRFGLGLKTASLSQCRNLTVVTKHTNGEIVAARWDLDYLLQVKKWHLRWLDAEEFTQVPGFVELTKLDHGTLVIWQSLDLLFQGTAPKASALVHQFDEVSRHLGLVFHRFAARKKNPLIIRVNGKQVPSFDPFLENEIGTLEKGQVKVTINDSPVFVRPYILPSISKMTRQQREKAIFDKNMREAQGFYIYRNDRLLTWGTWFRTAALAETSKLARVKVETDKSLDSQWRLGVMKSSVEPPHDLLLALKKLVPEITEQAERASVGKSVVVSHGDEHPWLFKELGDGAFQLEINREYPLIQALELRMEPKSISLLESFFRYLEATFPSVAIHHRLAADNHHRDGFKSDDEILAEATMLMRAIAETLNVEEDAAWRAVDETPPFATDLQLKNRLHRLRRETHE